MALGSNMSNASDFYHDLSHNLGNQSDGAGHAHNSGLSTLFLVIVNFNLFGNCWRF